MMISKIKSKTISKLVYLKYMLGLKRRTRLSLEKAIYILKSYHSQEKPQFSQNNTIKPTVDLQIIVPIYNVKEYLDDCICSLLNQKTEFTYRIVAVNDGSTDGSELILQKYRNHSSITIIQQQNSGLSKARNTALQLISGKYVMFVDSDDFLPDNGIELIEDLEENSKYIMI